MIAGRKLLLADDSVAIRKVIDLTFTDEGMEVTTVGDGQDALDKLEYFTPDVVLADIYMPGVDGYELCRFIKENERFRGVPVMLLVGSFEPFDEAAAKRAGADDVVTKPFQSIRDLVSRVGSLVGHDEEASRHSVLGLSKPETSASIASIDGTEVPTADVPVEAEAMEQPSVKVFVEAPVMETTSAPTGVVPIVEAEAADHPEVKVFVEAPVMETAEEPMAQEHTCPPDIEMQTADTKQLERITDEPSDQHMNTPELEVVEESDARVRTEEAAASQVRLNESVDQLSEVEVAQFADEGVLDLGDIDSYAPGTLTEDFELDIEVAPVASFTESAVLDNEPGVQSIDLEATQESMTERVRQDVFSLRPIEATSTQHSDAGAHQPNPAQLSPEAIEAISRRVVEQLSEKVVREIAWEVVPELSELLIKKRLEEQK